MKNKFITLIVLVVICLTTTAFIDAKNISENFEMKESTKISEIENIAVDPSGILCYPYFRICAYITVDEEELVVAGLRIPIML